MLNGDNLVKNGIKLCLEDKVDIVYLGLIKSSDDELRHLARNLYPEKEGDILKVRNLLLSKMGNKATKVAEEVYNDLDAVMFSLKTYGPKTAHSVSAELNCRFKPLMDIVRWDAQRIGCEGMEVHEIYEKVKRDERTAFHMLNSELAPYNEIINAWKHGKERPLLIDNEVEGKFYDFELGVRHRMGRNDRITSLPYLAGVSALLSFSPMKGVISLATLTLFSLSREVLNRGLENSRKIRPYLRMADKKINKLTPRHFGNIERKVLNTLNRLEARKKARKHLKDGMKRRENLRTAGSTPGYAFDEEKRMEEYEKMLGVDGGCEWLGRKAVDGLYSTERLLNRFRLSLSYIAIVGAEYLLGIPIDPITTGIYLYGIPAIGYGTEKFKTGKNKLEAYIRATHDVGRTCIDEPSSMPLLTLAPLAPYIGQKLVSILEKTPWSRLGPRLVHSWKKIREGAKKYEMDSEAEQQLESPPDPKKQGIHRKIIRGLGTFKIPIPRLKRYVDVKDFRIRRRLRPEDLEDVKRLVVEELKKGYSPEVIEKLEKHYLPCVKVGEDELNRARGITGTVHATVIHRCSGDARKIRETGYTFGSIEFLRPYVQEMVKARGEDEGMEVKVRKKVDEEWKTEAYMPDIFKHDDDFQILAVNPDYEELILGVDTEKERAMKTHRVARYLEPKVGRLSGRLADRLFYETRTQLLCSGSAVKNIRENAIKTGLLTQVPKVSYTGEKAAITYDLEDFEIYISDMLSREEAACCLYHDVEHVAHRLQAWETVKDFGEVIFKKLDKKVNP